MSELTTYTHNVAGELSVLETTGPHRVSYTYDAAGRRTVTRYPSGVSTSVSYDNANQVSTRVNGGTANYTFDADGNLLNNPPAGTAGQWDYENRMVKSSALTNLFTLTYDYEATNALVRQVTKLGAFRFTNTYDWDKDWNLAGASKAGVAHVYVPEPGTYGPIAAKREATTLYFPLYDALGSVISVVKSDGTSMGSQRFDAYGERIATNLSVLSDLGWLGKWGYLTGLAWGPLYVRNRWYDTGLARWISKDPAEDDLVNLYRYVMNRPLVMWDPSGMYCCGEEEREECCEEDRIKSESKCSCTSVVITKFQSVGTEQFQVMENIRAKKDNREPVKLAGGGGYLITVRATGTGDNTKCKFSRTVDDFVMSTENGKLIVDRNDKGQHKPEDPPPAGGFITQLGITPSGWVYTTSDSPGHAYTLQYLPAIKQAHYRFKVQDSDGTFNAACIIEYWIHIDIDKNGKVKQSSGRGNPFDLKIPDPSQA